MLSDQADRLRPASVLTGLPTQWAAGFEIQGGQAAKPRRKGRQLPGPRWTPTSLGCRNQASLVLALISPPPHHEQSIPLRILGPV